MPLNEKFIIKEWDKLSEQERELLEIAANYRPQAHAPCTNFKVGAALRSDSGAIYGGLNIEDIALNGTMHAETVALGNMVVDLGREMRIAAIAIVLGPGDVEINMPPKRRGDDITEDRQLMGTPCGHCRTMLAQFASKDGTRVLALQPNGQVLITDIATLYPAGFGF